MELEEAVKNLNNYIFAIDNFATIDPKCCNNLYEPAKVILKELDKKDKVIDEMIDYIDGMGDTPDILCENYKKEYYKNIKQYFYKKVEEQE